MSPAPGALHDPHVLPAGLPQPVDDGACDHLPGARVPSLVLRSTHGPLDLAELASRRAVLYVYPRTGRPGVPPPDGWDAIPGARGCTPQSCAFRDMAGQLDRLGARVAGLSVQSLEEQVEFSERNRMSFPLVSDPGLELAEALGLPTFEVEGVRLYRRVTLVLEAGAVARAFYPVFPPDRNAAEVAAWLEAQVAR